MSADHACRSRGDTYRGRGDALGALIGLVSCIGSDSSGWHSRVAHMKKHAADVVKQINMVVM